MPCVLSSSPRVVHKTSSTLKHEVSRSYQSRIPCSNDDHIVLSDLIRESAFRLDDAFTAKDARLYAALRGPVIPLGSRGWQHIDSYNLQSISVRLTCDLYSMHLDRMTRPLGQPRYARLFSLGHRALERIRAKSWKLRRCAL